MFFSIFFTLCIGSVAAIDYSWDAQYLGKECLLEKQLLVNAYLLADSDECTVSHTLPCTTNTGSGRSIDRVCPVFTPPRGARPGYILIERYSDTNCTSIPTWIQTRKNNYCDDVMDQVYVCNATTGIITEHGKPFCSGLLDYDNPRNTYQHGKCVKSFRGYSTAYFCDRGFLQQGVQSTEPIVTTSSAVRVSATILTIVLLLTLTAK